MNDRQAQEAAQQILANNPPGTEISFMNEGMMAHNPHYSAQNGWHSDGYHAVILPNGQVAVDKFHAPHTGNGQ